MIKMETFGLRREFMEKTGKGIEFWDTTLGYDVTENGKKIGNILRLGKNKWGASTPLVKTKTRHEAAHVLQREAKYRARQKAKAKK